MKYITIFLFCILIIAGIVFGEGQGKGVTVTNGEVEVLHWLTDSRDAAAIAVLKQLLEDEGYLTDLNDVAQAEEWDKLIPKVVADIMKYKENYVAVPVYIHRINWMWCNPGAFEKADAEIPETWK